MTLTQLQVESKIHHKIRLASVVDGDLNKALIPDLMQDAEIQEIAKAVRTMPLSGKTTRMFDRFNFRCADLGITENRGYNLNVLRMGVFENLKEQARKV